jgi:uncharacterized membrane protein
VEEVQVETGKDKNAKRARLTLEEKKILVEAVHEAELKTTGEIKVHFSYLEKENDILKSAKRYFESLRMHETTHHNGMLLYVNPSLKKFCVFGDEGIHKRVKQAFWDKLVVDVSHAIREKNLIHGVVHAVQVMGRALSEHYPASGHDQNEISDDISESE